MARKTDVGHETNKTERRRGRRRTGSLKAMPQSDERYITTISHFAIPFTKAFNHSGPLIFKHSCLQTAGFIFRKYYSDVHRVNRPFDLYIELFADVHAGTRIDRYKSYSIEAIVKLQQISR